MPAKRWGEGADVAAAVRALARPDIAYSTGTVDQCRWRADDPAPLMPPGRTRHKRPDRTRKGDGRSLPYSEILSSESSVPICWKVVTIWFDEVSRKNLSELLAQP